MGVYSLIPTTPTRSICIYPIFTDQRRTLRARSCEAPRGVFSESHIKCVGCIVLKTARLGEADLHMDDTFDESVLIVFPGMETSRDRNGSGSTLLLPRGLPYIRRG